eukprot:2227406-Pleurochrysis_carterae.AAC.1
MFLVRGALAAAKLASADAASCSNPAVVASAVIVYSSTSKVGQTAATSQQNVQPSAVDEALAQDKGLQVEE